MHAVKLTLQTLAFLLLMLLFVGVATLLIVPILVLSTIEGVVNKVKTGKFDIDFRVEE